MSPRMRTFQVIQSCKEDIQGFHAFNFFKGGGKLWIGAEELLQAC